MARLLCGAGSPLPTSISELLLVTLLHGMVYSFCAATHEPLANVHRLSILFSFCIYILAGRDIWQKRQQLRAFSNTHANNVDLAVIENPFDGFQKTTEIQVTTEIFQVGGSNDNASQISVKLDPQDQNMSHNGYEQYTAHIGRGPRGSLVPAVSYNTRQTNAAMEANTAVLGYFKCCVLFFASLLITWVSLSLIFSNLLRGSSIINT